MAKDPLFEQDPFWYKDAIIYQLHVKSFFDSNDDGIGDFRGLIQKLDYIEGLGVTALWLMPFYPSPLKDDGYDIARYFDVHPDYGTLRDFKDFMKEAHRRGIRVITELVLNHTSDQHPWFQRARIAKEGSSWRDFYVWSKTPEKYKDARIIFKDFETSNWAWDPVAKSYYWHRFYSHQPDLNYENPAVQRSLLKVLDNWLGIGVDGLRLDAVPYLFEREGTNCENLPDTYEFLRKLRGHVDGKFTDRMLLAEANQWPEDAVAYFGDGDICQMAFHFPVMPRIFMAIQMEDRFPIVDILGQTPSIPDPCQWAMFLRNHDELTLEMVTDEERDYMYRVYARDPKARINLGIRRRLAPLVGNNRRKIELMNILLFSLPGTPIIYYGDEIGMGDNYYLGDRNGVRTPMQWSSDRNAGFSRANPQKLYLPVIIDPEYHYEALNAENELANPSSLLWWMKRTMAMRKKYKAFGRGSMDFIQSDNPKVIAFIREYQSEIILVVINLSRFSQVVRLDLSSYAGLVPQEVFSQNRFPTIIKETPYVLSLGFHDYFWFALQREEEGVRLRDLIWVVPELRVKGGWEKIFEGKTVERLVDEVLPPYIRGCRWFAGKGRNIQKIEVIDNIPVRKEPSSTQILFIEVSYSQGTPDTYLIPLSFASGERAEKIAAEKPNAVVADVKSDAGDGIIYEGIYDDEFGSGLLQTIEKRRAFKGKHGKLVANPGRIFRSLLGDKVVPLSSQLLKAEQSNTSFLYENTFFLKLYRRIEEGINPDVEMLRFLTEKTGYKNIAPYAGAIEYRRPNAPPISIGHLQGFVENRRDAWGHTLDALGHFFEGVLSTGSAKEPPSFPSSLFGIGFSDVPPVLQELIGGFYLEMTSLLGKRTGEMHIALSGSEEPDFSPEPFSMLYQRSIYQSMRSLTAKNMQLLRANIKNLPESVRKEAAEVLALEETIVESFQGIREKKISAMKTRYHGDYHLGQVLFTGKDFVIIDFEGEPARPLGERRLKRSPLRDMAGMIRSFHYVVHSALIKQGAVRPGNTALLEQWGEAWYHYVSGIFLDSYLHTVEDAPFMPKERGELETLLICFLLEKAVYELGYEMNNRPDWLVIPIRGIKQIIRKT